MLLSIIIPVYNEAESLSELLERITQTCQQYGSYEIICVDDGSTDGSFELLCRLKKQYPKLDIIQFEVNAGQSAALAAGLRKAQGEVIITLDADLQNPPEAIPLMLKHLEGVDAVVGWRKSRQDPWVKRMGSRVANRIRRFVLGDPFHDNGCTLKAFKREIVQDLCMFEGMIGFLSNLIQIEGYTVREVVVPHEPRRYGRSKYKKFSFSGVQAFFNMLFVLSLEKRKLSYKIEKARL